MWIRTVISACVGIVLTVPGVAVTWAAQPDQSRVEPQAVGLWDPGFTPGSSIADCGRWSLDAQRFCTADDVRNGVELGMKFQSSVSLEVTGVRVYRVDPRTLTGSLWDGDGTRLATGTFAAGTLGWQDLTFDTPVRIRADRTYLATYYSPSTKYAFGYDYFGGQITRGPITALRSVAGDPNGVHCYDVGRCDYPRNGFRDSNYWVTPLWKNPAADTSVLPPAVLGPSTDRVAPSVRTSNPRGGQKRIGLRTTIRVQFSESVRSPLLTRANVKLLRKGQRAPVAAKLRYDARRNRLSLDPRGSLRPRSVYRVVISSAVVDTAGNRLDQDPRREGAQRATWTFRTR